MANCPKSLVFIYNHGYETRQYGNVTISFLLYCAVMNANSSKFMALPLWLYVVGWVFFLHLFISILQFSAENSNNLIISAMYMINFGVHEVSHIIASFLPAILTAAAGSIGEVSFTLLLLFATIKEKAYFAAVFAAQWVMLGFVSAGRYMADARTQNMPLIGPGETVTHDWHFVFSELGWLGADTLIGGTAKIIGIGIGMAGLLFGLYLMAYKLFGDKK